MDLSFDIAEDLCILKQRQPSTPNTITTMANIHNLLNLSCSDNKRFDSFEEGFRSRKKKRDKTREKKHRHMKIKNELSRRDRCWHISRRKKGWKTSKRNRGSKYGYINFDDDMLEGEVVMNKKVRTQLLSSKTSIIDEFYLHGFYLAMRGTCFDIPQELLIHVLSRLSLKSFARLKCVSKQWNRFISNAITIRNPPKLLFLSCLWDCFSFHSLDEKLHVESFSNPFAVEDLILSGHCIVAHSSCNGFLLFEIDHDFFVWNPLTKFSRKVLTKNDYAYKRYYDSNTLANLCFDNANNVYKIVLVTQCFSPGWSSEKFQVAICGATSCEKLDVPSTVRNVCRGPSFRGYKHWISEGNHYYFDQSNLLLNHIVYFDPSNNEFIEVPMPQPRKGETDTIVGLGVLDDCLCLTRWDNPWNYEGNIEFLSMKEYGNGDSWEVMFVVLNLLEFRVYDIMLPLFKTNEDEVVVCVKIGSDDWSVKAYDVNGNFLSDKLTVPEYPNRKLVVYEESWFLPTNGLENVEASV